MVIIRGAKVGVMDEILSRPWQEVTLTEGDLELLVSLGKKAHHVLCERECEAIFNPDADHRCRSEKEVC